LISRPKALVLTSDHEEARSIGKALEDFALLACVATIAEMKFALEQADYDVVFCSWSYYRSTWGGALNEVRQRYPDLPMIVLSRDEGAQEWDEVVEAGAFDLLALPCPEQLAVALIEQAAASHEARKARKIMASGREASHRFAYKRSSLTLCGSRWKTSTP